MQTSRRILFFFLVIYLLAAALPCAVHADLSEAGGGKIVIVIDAGHGGIDGGTSVGTHTEKEYNLKLATYLAAVLNEDGRFDARLTRTEDIFLTHLERAMVARDARADLYVSMHCNSNPSASPNGLTAYVSVVDRFNASDLAGKILDAISASVSLKRGRVETREDTGDTLGVYYWSDERQWDMPAAYSLGKTSDYYSANTWASKFGIRSIIIEHGYLSNESDRAVLDDNANLWAIASAEARAIVNYFTGHEHVFGEVETDAPSNCAMRGTASAHCKICGARKGVTTLPEAPDNHWWRTLESVPATCTEDGYLKAVCQISYNLNTKDYPIDVHLKEEVLPATGHSWTLIEETPAAHGQQGRVVKRCENCGEEVTEVTAADPHTFTVTEEKAATCTENGLRTERCTVCGEIRTETIPAPGHDYVEAERAEPTAEADGYVLSRCTRCGAEQKEILSTCPHEFEVERVEPTCEKDGSVTSTCLLCGYVKTEVLPSPGHQYEVMMEVDPTCTEEGFYRGKCSVCGNVLTERTPPAGHHYIIKEENETRVVRVCTICGDEVTQEKPGVLRSLSNLSPAAIVIIAVILIQLIVIVVLIIHGARGIGFAPKREKKKKRRKPLWEDEDDDEDDDV